MNRIILFSLILFFLHPISSIASDSDIATLYKKYAIEGAIIIASLDGQIEYIHNIKRAQQRFLPASTFKILNTLITLEEEIIKDEKEVIKWDGIDKGWVEWNKDHNLSSAFSVSCVWCYQKFAKQIGLKKYNLYLNKIAYGNKKTGTDVINFWLEGTLAISAKEQINLLRKLYLEDLPFKKQNIYLVKKIMLVDEKPAYKLSAKSGWAMRVKEQQGWYVGYVETAGKVWLFANNIEIIKPTDAQYRQKLVIESLKAKGII